MEAVRHEDETRGLFNRILVVSRILLTTAPPSSQPAHQHGHANENVGDLVILTQAAGLPRPPPHRRFS